MERIDSKRNYALGGLFGTATQKSHIKKNTVNTTKSSSVKKNSSNSFESILVENNSTSEVIELVDENGIIDEAKLSILQDDIYEAGEALLKKPGIDAVFVYRKKVQILLSSVTPLLHRKEQLPPSRKRIGNSFEERKYTVINTIHKKLDRLLQIVINSQSQQMSIMKALDEIKGLIINILH